MIIQVFCNRRGVSLEMRLRDKVALVTGGASGIPRTTALLLAIEGASVAVVDVQREKGEKAVQMIKERGGDAIFTYADVSKEVDVRRAVETAIETYGKLNIVYNGAGVLWTARKVEQTTEEEWDKYIDVNLKSVFLVSKNVIPEMAKAGGGAIVNTSSIWGADMGAVGAGAYVAAKAGIVGLTKTLALECAPYKIRVNTICAGGVVTPLHMRAQGGTVEDEKAVWEKFQEDPFYIPKTGELFTNEQRGSDAERQHLRNHPINRFGAPIDIANAVLFFVSEESSWITGTVLYVDGGYMAK